SRCGDEGTVIAQAHIHGEPVRRFPGVLQVEADHAPPPGHRLDDVAAGGAVRDVQQERSQRAAGAADTKRVGRLGVREADAGDTILVIPLDPVILGANLEHVRADQLGEAQAVVPTVSGAANVPLLLAAEEAGGVEAGIVGVAVHVRCDDVRRVSYLAGEIRRQGTVVVPRRGPLVHAAELVLEYRPGTEGVYPVPGQVVGAAIRGSRLRGEARGPFARVEEPG